MFCNQASVEHGDYGDMMLMEISSAWIVLQQERGWANYSSIQYSNVLYTETRRSIITARLNRHLHRTAYRIPLEMYASIGPLPVLSTCRQGDSDSWDSRVVGTPSLGLAA